MSAKKETTSTKAAETVLTATDTPQEGKKQPSTVDAIEMMHERAAERIKQGFIGVETDKTPNSHYSIEGVIAGMETPETTGENK